MFWGEMLEIILKSCSQSGLCRYCNLYRPEEGGCGYRTLPEQWSRRIRKIWAISDKEIDLWGTSEDPEEASYHQGVSDGIRIALSYLGEDEDERLYKSADSYKGSADRYKEDKE